MRRLLTFFCIVILTGCSSTRSGSVAVTCAQRFWNGAVAACLPEGWRVLSAETLQSLELPEETIAAFQYETPHAGQVDTVTVTREPLAEDTKTPAYSEANILAVSALPEYALIDRETVTVDGEETALHVFSARLSPDKPARRYYQLSVASGRTGYTFSGSFPLSIDDAEAKEVTFILRNVSLVEPQTSQD